MSRNLLALLVLLTVIPGCEKTISEREFRELQDSGTLYTGKVIASWPDTHEKLSETTYVNGKAEGIGIVWWKNGQMMKEVHWKDGKMEGVVTEWHQNGQMWQRFSLSDDMLEGLATEWEISGALKSESCYRKNKQVPISECK